MQEKIVPVNDQRVAMGLRAELMEEPEAIAVAYAEDGPHLLAAEQIGRDSGRGEGLLSGVETF